MKLFRLFLRLLRGEESILMLLRHARTLLLRFPSPVAWETKDLRNFEEHVYSQRGEDGIIKEICRRLKLGRGIFVEIGTEDGTECNCARLVRHEGWTGFFVEADQADFEALRSNYEGSPGVKCLQAKVTSSNIETLFEANGVPRNFELLSIDIDGNDYWIWKAINAYRPIIVVIEYNPAYPPPRTWVMKENDDHAWDKTTYQGASLASLAALGLAKGYRLIATGPKGCNAFFLRDDYFDENLFVAGSVAYHYSPPTHGRYGRGHPYRPGPHVDI